MELVIVTTMYDSALYLDEFYKRICNVADNITSDYEIIFVNDGSPDNSLDIALSLFEKDSRVKVINLSRNFGHHKAIMTGLKYARGDLVFLIDCDLEEHPELLGKFYAEYKKSDVDVIYGVQNRRGGDFLKQISGNFFYWIFNKLSNYQLPRNLLTVRLMSRRYVDALLEHKERETIIAGLWVVTGFKQKPFYVIKRNKGQSTYNFRNKIAHLVNAVTSFSDKPLIHIFYLGCIISFFSIIAAGFLIIRKIFFDKLLGGWPSLIVSIWMLGGLIIFCLGVIGIYLSKIFMETKKRPSTIIEKIFDRNENSEK
jgi:putative glycosyltransferase